MPSGKNKKKKSKEKRGGGGGSSVEPSPSKNMADTLAAARAALERIAAVAADTDDDPHRLKGDCPICLEPLPPWWDQKDSCGRVVSSCCGVWICTQCCDERDRAHASQINEITAKDIANTDDVLRVMEQNMTCPTCRSFDVEPDFCAELEGHAAAGRSWAQFSLGLAHIGAMDTAIVQSLRTDVKLGVRLLKQSAEQGYPLAITLLAEGLAEGKWGLRLSFVEAEKFFMLAAKNGDVNARYQLALLSRERAKEHLRTQTNNAVKDTDICNKRIVDELKLAADGGHSEAVMRLGKCYVEGHFGENPCPSQAQHFLRILEDAAGSDKSGRSNYCAATIHLALARTENKLGSIEAIEHLRLGSEKGYRRAQDLYGCQLCTWVTMERIKAKSDNITPWMEHTFCTGQAWIRRSQFGHSSQLDFGLKQTCFNCGDIAKGSNLRHCSKCKSATYCSRDCQVSHWHRSHKPICEEANKIAFKGEVSTEKRKKAEKLTRLLSEELLTKRASRGRN